ncbi:izumo sperm-egg fusion protein 4 isoform X1 [Heterocephalus glaber]|uniref:Izumo sperm-egg fusion protein 4 isoform X1 n=1 Tax=Heterocephalus glaber TaxID=10181 RepID=A0AAX6Q5Z4_HETGA|nr:izumo sperm-egg fusion protein 4 isoform X1 [Heterocephalus glaber]
MALLLCLGLTVALARGCLHCHNNFSEKFSFYRHNVNLKSWWVGDIPVSGALLTDWSKDTMKKLHLAIPAEITREDLNQVAETVYRKMDQLYQGKMYFPGYFPNELRVIFREQVHLIQNAIIKRQIDCQRHCGIFQYKTISCHNCSDSHFVCFGYNCESSVEWESAVRGLLIYIQDTSTRVGTVARALCAPGTASHLFCHLTHVTPCGHLMNKPRLLPPASPRLGHPEPPQPSYHQASCVWSHSAWST